MILELINTACLSRNLIGIQTETQDFEEYIVGFVEIFDNQKVVLLEIDKNGDSEGRTTIEIDTISCIIYNDRYLKRLLFIYNNKQFLRKDSKTVLIQSGEELLPTIKKLIESKTISRFMLEEDYYVIGVPVNLQNECLLINCIGVEGDDDGLSIYKISDIKGIQFNSISEQKIELMYRNQRKFYEYL